MKKLTMDQIAKDLNISKALVSLALADKYGVSEEMKSKIRLYALEHGYDFNKCRSAKNTPKSVLFLIESVEMFQEPFWSKIIAGVEHELTEQRIQLEILSCHNFLYYDSTILIDIEPLCQKIASYKPDGIISISRLSTNQVCRNLKKMHIPLVLIDNMGYTASDIDQVLIDNYHGGYNAGEYLVSMGHKNLCFVGDIKYADSFRQRFNGFRDFCESIDGISVKYLTSRFDENEIVCYNKQDLIAYLKEAKEHTAFMCANDQIAFQFYKICPSLGLTIGKDISVLGFDDVEPCKLTTPPLSSIHVHRYALGQTAVKVLANRINGDNKPCEIIQLSTYLCPRESVANLNTEILPEQSEKPDESTALSSKQ